MPTASAAQDLIRLLQENPDCWKKSAANAESPAALAEETRERTTEMNDRQGTRYATH